LKKGDLLLLPEKQKSLAVKIRHGFFITPLFYKGDFNNSEKN